MSNTNLPWISSNIPPDLRQFLERVRETLSGNEYVRRTDYLSGTVPRNPTDPPGPPEPPVPPKPPCGDPVTPTTPTGLQVSAGFEGFLLSWDMPGYCGHSHTEVYGLRRDGTSADLGVQNMLGESKGVLYSHVVNKPEDYWCFWIKHVNTLDEEGPFTGAGVCAKTALDPGAVIEVLKGQITETELYASLGAKIKLIDVTQPLSTLTQTAGISGRVIYATDPPTSPPVDPKLTAGDIWVDSNAFVALPAPGFYRTYRYTGSAWEEMTGGLDQLSYAFYDEKLVRADADSIEASKREGLFAGAFAGIGNAYKYFIQETAPVGTQVGDIWAWKDPENDADAIFKRFNGSAWVNTPPTETDPVNTNVDDERRAAKFWGSLTAAPTVGLVIGDQYLHSKRYLTGTTPDPKYNTIFVYTGIAGAGLWAATTPASAFASAMVYQEQLVRADEDSNVLAQATQLVYATAGDSRANITPNACFSDATTGYTGSVTGFAVVSGNFGRAYIKTGAVYTESGLIGMPVFLVAPGRVYSFTTNARILLPSNGTGSCRLGIQFFASTDGTGAIIASNLTDYVPADPAQGGMDFDTTYVVAGATVSQRQRFALKAQPAPSNAQSARLVFQWTVSQATNIGFTRPQVVVGELPLPTFNCDGMAGDVDVTSALVADVATARIGYCTQGNIANGAETVTTIPTDAVTKQVCEALVPPVTGKPQNTWQVGIPFASAVKQVAVDGKAYCIKAGKQTADATPEACTSNGGVWTDPGAVAIQQAFEALQKSTGELYAQYSVKIDQNGFVSGFGLSSETTTNGTPFSNFLVRADRFAIASPTAPGAIKTVSSLSQITTTATCVTTTAHGFVVGDDVSIYGTTDARWNKTFTVTNVPNTTTFRFIISTIPPTAVAAPGQTITAQKISVPFIVTTTDVCLVGGVNSTGLYPTEALCTGAKGTWVPAGTYIDDAFINKAVINWAQIKEATIDYAKITTAVIDDLTVTGLQVGDCIKSAAWYDQANNVPMWRICGDGNALFNNASIRGTIYGQNATSYDLGKGYFFGAERARIGDPAGSYLAWDGFSLLIQGTVQSSTYQQGTAGWKINVNGDAEFGTLALRSNAVSEASFVPTSGTLPGQTLTFPPTWASGVSYTIGALVYYDVNQLIYVCRANTSSALPTNTTFWTVSSNYKTLASITTSAANLADGGGMLFFGRARASSTTSATMPRSIGPSGDMQVRLVQDVGGVLTTIGEMGYVLSYGGLRAGLHYFSVPVTVFEYAGAKTGTFRLQAKSNVSGVTVDVDSISLGYLALKR